MSEAVIKLGLDASAFENGLRSAAAKAQQFAGGLLEKFAGSGAAGGIAMGAALGIGLGRAAIDARNQMNDFHSSVLRATSNIGGGAFRSTEEIDKSISTLQSKMDELRATNIEFHGIPTTARAIWASDAMFPGMKSTQSVQQAGELKTLQSAIKIELAAQIEKQHDLVSIQKEVFSGSQREVEKMKEMRRFKEEIGAIDERYAGVEGGGPARNELQKAAAERNLQNLETIDRTYDIKKDQAETEYRITELGAKSVNNDKTRLAIAKERLGVLNRQLQHPMQDEDRLKLSSQRLGAASDVFNAGLALDNIDHGEGGYNFAYHNQLRRSQREKSAYLAREKDAADRHSRDSKADKEQDDGGSDSLLGAVQQILGLVQSMAD